MVVVPLSIASWTSVHVNSSRKTVSGVWEKSKEETAVEIENAKHVLLDMLDVQISRFKYRKGFSKKRFYSNAPAASNI
jgi:hypothetical protein